ncbi:MAG: hypothetical protein P4M07_28525 [Xanthobacteraceae bacterium]|nr:hypothetical protein [Xanthobacteraceae bacterium]
MSVGGFMAASTETAGAAVIYCQYIEYPAGCVVRPGAVLRPRPVARAAPMNRGGPVNRVGPR